MGTQRAGGYSAAPLWQTQGECRHRFGRRAIKSTPEAAAISASFRLDGRVALITGAGRGIGAAGALALAEAGAEVVLLSRTRSELEQVAKSVVHAGGKARVIVCDVTKREEVNYALASIERLDILLNNAGMNIPEPFVDVSEAHLDDMISLNVRAAFLVSQAAVRNMLQYPDRRKQGGSIVHLTSQMGRVGAERRTVYCMAKHAIEGLTKAMAVELAPENIRVNAIAPTFLETPMTASFFADPEFRNWVISRIPLGRIGRMDEVTGAIVFLVSPAASLITGASLAVDGGWTAR